MLKEATHISSDCVSSSLSLPPVVDSIKGFVRSTPQSKCETAKSTIGGKIKRRRKMIWKKPRGPTSSRVPALHHTGRNPGVLTGQSRLVSFGTAPNLRLQARPTLLEQLQWVPLPARVYQSDYGQRHLGNEQGKQCLLQRQQGVRPPIRSCTKPSLLWPASSRFPPAVLWCL